MASKKIPFYSDPEFLRKQSLFLGISFVLMLVVGSMAMFVVTSLEQLDEWAYVTPLKIGTKIDKLNVKLDLNFDLENILLKSLFAVAIALQIGAWFTYKNRKTQVNFVTFSLIVTVSHILLLGYVYKRFTEVPSSTVIIGFSSLLLLFPPILQYLALRGIKSDINKLKQASRFWS